MFIISALLIYLQATDVNKLITIIITNISSNLAFYTFQVRHQTDLECNYVEIRINDHNKINYGQCPKNIDVAKITQYIQ